MERKGKFWLVGLVAAVGTGLVVYFVSRKPPEQPGPTPAVGVAEAPSPGAESRRGPEELAVQREEEASWRALASARLEVAPRDLTAELLHDLILNRYPGFEDLDEETRNYVIRQLLRDTLEKRMSMDEIAMEVQFAWELRREGRLNDALNVLVAAYDVTSDPENINRAVCREELAGEDDGWFSAPVVVMVQLAVAINELLKQMGREEEANEWVKEVKADVDSVEPAVMSGAEKASLLVLKRFLECESAGGKFEGEGEVSAFYDAAEFLEEYLKRDDLEPEDIKVSRSLLDQLNREFRGLEKMLNAYEKVQQRDDGE